jgi:hypothetical protein
MTTAAAIRQMANLARQGQTESVVYRPASPGAGKPATRTIQALVTRGVPEPYLSGAAPVLHVCVLNDATDGISSAEVDTGADLIDVPERFGGTAGGKGIAQIAAQDPEFLTLEMR